MTILEFIKKEEDRLDDLYESAKRWRNKAAENQEVKEFRAWDSICKNYLTRWAALYDLISKIEELPFGDAIPVEWLLSHQRVDGNDGILELVELWRKENE